MLTRLLRGLGKNERGDPTNNNNNNDDGCRPILVTRSATRRGGGGKTEELVAVEVVGISVRAPASQPIG